MKPQVARGDTPFYHYPINFNKSKYKRGPRTEPCGTPRSTLSYGFPAAGESMIFLPDGLIQKAIDSIRL